MGKFSLKLRRVVMHQFGHRREINEKTNYLSSLFFGSVTFKKAARKLAYIDHLKTKRRPLYLNTKFVPRSKHFSSRL